MFGPRVVKALAKGKWKTLSPLSGDLDVLYENVNVQKLIFGFTKLIRLKIYMLKLGMLGDTRGDQ